MYMTTKSTKSHKGSMLGKQWHAITPVLFPTRDSAKCQSSGAAFGSQAYKKCRALLEDKMSIENDVPPDRSYASTRGR